MVWQAQKYRTLGGWLLFFCCWDAFLLMKNVYVLLYSIAFFLERRAQYFLSDDFLFETIASSALFLFSIGILYVRFSSIIHRKKKRILLTYILPAVFVFLVFFITTNQNFTQPLVIDAFLQVLVASGMTVYYEISKRCTIYFLPEAAYDAMQSDVKNGLTIFYSYINT